MDLLRNVSEGLARKTTRRGLFGRSAELATGALLGVAAGTLTRPGGAIATDRATHCVFPGGPCPCDGCTDTGPCAKPCIFNTTWYTSGCWVVPSSASGGKPPITCCDCNCQGMEGIHTCGCGTDYHLDPNNCP